MFVIRLNTNSTIEGQPPRYLCHAIPINGYVFFTFGGKSDAKTFATKEKAMRFLELPGMPAGYFEVEEAGRFLKLPGLIAECPDDEPDEHRGGEGQEYEEGANE